MSIHRYQGIPAIKPVFTRIAATVATSTAHQSSDSRIESIDYARHIKNPGEFLYTRGIHPTGYRGKPWTMRQFEGFGTHSYDLPCS